MIHTSWIIYHQDIADLQKPGQEVLRQGLRSGYDYSFGVGQPTANGKFQIYPCNRLA